MREREREEEDNGASKIDPSGKEGHCTTLLTHSIRSLQVNSNNIHIVDMYINIKLKLLIQFVINYRRL